MGDELKVGRFPPLISITPLSRGWLNVRVDGDDHAILKKLASEIECILGERHNWIGYDGEAPVITIELRRRDSTRPDAELQREAMELMREWWEHDPK